MSEASRLSKAAPCRRRCAGCGLLFDAVRWRSVHSKPATWPIVLSATCRASSAKCAAASAGRSLPAVSCNASAHLAMASEGSAGWCRQSATAHALTQIARGSMLESGNGLSDLAIAAEWASFLCQCQRQAEARYDRQIARTASETEASQTSLAWKMRSQPCGGLGPKQPCVSNISLTLTGLTIGGRSRIRRLTGTVNSRQPQRLAATWPPTRNCGDLRLDVVGLDSALTLILRAELGFFGEIGLGSVPLDDVEAIVSAEHLEAKAVDE
jgi:hypothetical protein